MINEIRLKNFKCFDKSIIPIRKLSILSGINGVGKSTVIQSLLALRQSHILDSFSEKRLDINGTLVNFGTAIDLYYDGASDNAGMEISLGYDNKSIDFNFAYVGEHFQLTSKLELFEKNMSDLNLFSVEKFYYLDAERRGSQQPFPFYDNGKLNKIGNAGEYAPHLLYQFENKKILESKLREDSISNSLGSELNLWLSDLGLPVRVELNVNEFAQQVSIGFKFKQGKLYSDAYTAMNVGFGLTYSLPVILVPLIAEEGSLIIIENPEAHLHPQGQVMIGHFLAKMAASGLQIIVETHSDHVLNGIRLAVKNTEILAEDISFIFITKSEDNLASEVITPEIDKDGRIDEWPDGFFDEFEKVLFELL